MIERTELVLRRVRKDGEINQKINLLAFLCCTCVEQRLCILVCLHNYRNDKQG